MNVCNLRVLTVSFGRILIVLDIALFALGAGVGVHALRDAGSAPPDLNGLWKVAKAYTREPDGRWREELGASRTFREFRDGVACARYRATPEFACERYDPYTLQGNILAIGRGSGNTRERAERRGNQLQVITEEWRNQGWRETRREVYVRVMSGNE